jgi:hypothetical protein
LENSKFELYCVILSLPPSTFLAQAQEAQETQETIQKTLHFLHFMRRFGPFHKPLAEKQHSYLG